MVILVNITMQVIVIWRCYAGEINASVASISGLATAVFGNVALLVGFNIRRRREGQKIPRNIVVFGLLLGIAGTGGTAAGARLISTQDDFVQLARSTRPLDDIRPPQKRLVVQLLRRREHLSSDYARSAAAVKPISPPLYSPNSFATLAAIRSTSAAIGEAATKDFEYLAQRQEATDEFRDQMTRIDPRSEYVRAWEQTANREAAFATLEKDWVSSVMDLYGYAAIHTGSLSVIDGRIILSGDGERTEFVALLEKSMALHTSFQSELQKSVADQRPARSITELDK